MNGFSFSQIVPVLALGLAACGAPTADDICESIGECAGSTPEQVTECKEDANAFANDAIADACEDQLDAYLSCIADEDLCNEDTLEHGCAAEAHAIEDCQHPHGEDDEDPPAPG